VFGDVEPSKQSSVAAAPRVVAHANPVAWPERLAYLGSALGHSRAVLYDRRAASDRLLSRMHPTHDRPARTVLDDLLLADERTLRFNPLGLEGP